MSHFKERKEKICLNCNAAIYGRFCHVCGQENIDPKESFWYLTTHFIADIFHYDGKFLRTLKYLLFKPGYLAHEHLRGRRADYLHPVRLYIFVSALFFLLMIAFFTNKQKSIFISEQSNWKTALAEYKKEKEDLSSGKILLYRSGEKFKSKQERIVALDSAIALLQKDTANFELTQKLLDDELEGTKNLSYEDYLRQQALLPTDKKDGYITKKSTLLNYYLKEKAKAENTQAGTIAIELFMHNTPKVMFVTLPLIAFVFFLFYIRNKNLLYVNHLIFTIYLFCFYYIAILISQTTTRIFSTVFKTSITSYFGLIVFAFVLLYTYKSFKNFYNQSRLKTILKLFLLSIPLVLIFIFFIFALFLTTALFI